MARGLGFTETAASGNECVKWTRVRKYLESLGIDTSVDGKLPDYILENIFYRLVCAACANANASLMGVQGVRLRLFFQILCGCAGGTATDDARVKCAHKWKALLHADFDQGWGHRPFSEDSEAYFSFFGGYFLTIYRKTDFFAFFGGFSISNFQIIYIYIIKFDINFDSNQLFSRLVLICLHERQSLVLLDLFCFRWSWFSLNTTFAL